MLDKSELDKYDIQGMYKIYDKWPEIAHKFYQKKIECVNYENIDHIAFAGMGGSGTIGDIFSSILSKENIHVSVVKGYLLPKTVDENTLVVITSVSGDTSETLTILKNATKNNIKTISFASGGEIEKMCKKNNLKFFKIPKYHSPRASLIPFLYAILNILNSLLPIKKKEVLESILQLEQTKKNIFSHNLTKNNISLNLAEWIKDIPVIYYPFGLQSAAIRFKNSLQENAKIHVFAEDVIETSHNGIVSYEKKSIVKPILIEGVDDYFKTKQRWEVIKEFFDENKIEYREIFSVKGGILSKLINLIYLLDYASIYLATLRKIDPTFIKKKMNENSNFLE